MIDLDHNATTMLDVRARIAMVAVMEDAHLHGNPSSVHRGGQRARALVERARTAVRTAVGAEDAEVTFTSGGTEADNLAILGACRALRAAERPADVVTSPLEHPAVLGAVDALRGAGHRATTVVVDGLGRIGAGAVMRALGDSPNAGLVSLAAANHEVGNAYDVARLVREVRDAAPQALFHTDAVQALGKIGVAFDGWGVDLLSISAHKVGGPKGVGALVHRRGVALEPLLHGGHQARGLRPGTENVVGIVGFARALELLHDELSDRRQHVMGLRERVLAGVREVPGARVHGDPEHHSGNTVNVGFDGCDGQLLLMALDLEGIAVSTGAACASGTLEPSPVLLALGCSEAEARAAIRISLGHDNTVEDVERLLALLPGIVARVRGQGGDAA